jgi:ABC-type phosphate transport system substrate-binding protein
MLRNKALIVLAALGIGADASMAAAQSLYGSDTLKDLTIDAVNAAVTAGAIGAGSISYKGTGSGQGGKAMNAGDAAAVPVIPAGNQQISPQSRFLQDAECGAAVPGAGSTAGDALEIGLDAIGIYRSKLGTTPATNCNTVRYSQAGADGQPLDASFTIAQWRDVLRLVYAGVFPAASPTADPCTDLPPSRSAVVAAAGRCDHPARKALIANWGKLFQEGNCTTGNCPTGLRHAFRRDDSSGTTDTFLTLLGLPQTTPAANRPFCNGLESEDNDLIRTTCDANENVCATIPFANRATATDPPAAGGDLGVVLAVTLPTDTTKQYSTLACGLGRFSFTAMPTAIAPINQKCPDGNSRSGNLCRAPISNTSKFGCNAVKGTAPANRTFVNMDGRAYNLTPRDPDTGALLITPTGVTDPRWGGGAWYKIHQTNVMGNAGAGAVTCRQDDATRQIGCLVQADPCSLGYAGLGAAKWTGNEATSNNQPLNIQVPVGGNVTANALDDAAIKKLLLAPGGTAPNCTSDIGTRYALSRSLYVSASKGLDNVNDGPTAGNVKDEKKFITWIKGNKGQIDTFLNKYDFVPTGLTAFRTFGCASTTKAEPRVLK